MTPTVTEIFLATILVITAFGMGRIYQCSVTSEKQHRELLNTLNRRNKEKNK